MVKYYVPKDEIDQISRLVGLYVCKTLEKAKKFVYVQNLRW